MLVKSLLKKIYSVPLLTLPILMSASTFGATEDLEDYDYQFASTPFEYASLISSAIKPNLIFLVDNSPFTPLARSTEIINAIMGDQDIINKTRSGLAFTYANTHPFQVFEIPTEFMKCTAEAAGTSASSAIASIAGIVATGGTGLAVIIPAVIGIILPTIATKLPDCLAKINSPNNFKLSTQPTTFEVPIADSTSNSSIIMLNMGLASAAPQFGVPIVTRRYYEITQEIRGLDPENSFKNWNTENTNSTSSSLTDITEAFNSINTFINAFPIPILQQAGSSITSLLTAITKIPTALSGQIPTYKPLFKDAILYRCQTNFVVIITSGVTTPNKVAEDNSISSFFNIINQVFSGLADVINGLPGNIISVPDFSRFIPKTDLNKLTIRTDDNLIRNGSASFTKNTITSTLNFDEWNGNQTTNLTANESEHYGEYGLAFLSQIFDSSDLKTSGNDNEGKSWNQEDFPNQNITTIVVSVLPGDEGLMAGIFKPILSTVSNEPYMENAASVLVRIGKKGYFVGMSAPDGIKKVIKEAIMSTSNNNLSPASSTILNKMEPFQGVSANLNTQNWSSNLRFYNLNRRQLENSPDKDYSVNLQSYTTPDFGNLTDNKNGDGSRRVIVSTGKTKPEFLDDSNNTFNKWLVRPSNQSDKDIDPNLRNRCADDNSATCADRMLGDIINSPILAIDDDPTNRNRNNDPYASFIVTAANDGMVHIFKKTNNASKPYQLVLDYLPAAAKRGNSTTIWEQLSNIAHPSYGRHELHPHQYFNNGGIAYMGSMKKDCSASKEDFTCESNPAQLFMVGSYGQGGRGLYALNLGGKAFNSNNSIALSTTNQENWLTDVPLWESGSNQYGANLNDTESFTAHQRLGYIIGAPVIATVALQRTKNNELNQMKPTNGGDIRYAVFAPNGFYSDDSSPTLYIFDAIGVSKKESTSTNGTKSASNNIVPDNRGKLLAMISTNSVSNDPRNGLSSPTVVDTDNDGIADVVYAGDYNGNLYRFDLRKANPRDWTVKKIFKSSGDGLVNQEPKQPITTAPTVYKLDSSGSKYVVVFGSGSDIFENQLLNNQTTHGSNQQAIYGIYDNLDDDNPPTLSKSDLLQQTMTQSSGQFKGNARTIVTLSNKPMTKQYKGWFFNLTNGVGEQVVYSGKLTGNTLFFTTRIYNNNINNSLNACTNPITSNRTGYLIGINPRTGGRLKRNIMNLNPVIDRYRSEATFISGFKLDGVPSELTFDTLGNNSITNRSGQFENGWEDGGITRSKHYDEGSLVVTSSVNEYYVISVKEPDYIRVKKINSREIF